MVQGVNCFHRVTPPVCLDRVQKRPFCLGGVTFGIQRKIGGIVLIDVRSHGRILERNALDM